MATGDIWACGLRDDTGNDLFIKAFDYLGNELFYQAINTPAAYNGYYNRGYIGIIAQEGTVVCIGGTTLYTKLPDDAGFSFVDYTFPYAPFGTVSKCTFSGFSGGKFIYCNEGVNYSGVRRSYYSESTDGMNWTRHIINNNEYGGATSAYYDSTTGYRYLKNPKLLDQDDDIVCYTSNFVTFTPILTYGMIDSALSPDFSDTNGKWCFYNDAFYMLFYDRYSETENPVVVKITVPGHTVSYLPIIGSGIDTGYYNFYAHSIRRFPNGVPYAILSENEGTTAGIYQLSGNTFIRNDALSGDIFWDTADSFTNNVDTRSIPTQYGHMTACGGSSYDIDLSSQIPESIVIEPYSHLIIPIVYYENIVRFVIPAAMTIEAGPYIPPEEEFWTEEKLALEMEYDYA